MPFTMPSGQRFSSFLMFAPPPQPQSSTLASGASSRKPNPHLASAPWPRFIMLTIILPPSPRGFRVFSKKDIFAASFSSFYETEFKEFRKASPRYLKSSRCAMIGSLQVVLGAPRVPPLSHIPHKSTGRMPAGLCSFAPSSRFSPESPDNPCAPTCCAKESLPTSCTMPWLCRKACYLRG